MRRREKRRTPCNAYQVHVDGVCWDTVVVGGRCEKKEQCITKDSACSASSKRCECTEDTEFDGDQCVALAGVRCPPRSVIANGMCFGTVAPGQFCQFDAQCAPHLGVCRQYASLFAASSAALDDAAADGRCGDVVCERGFRCFRGLCLREDVVPSSLPEADGCAALQCPPGFGCLNATCLTAECPLNKVPLHGRCVPKRSVGDGCREQAECPEGALCEADKCLCPRGYTWIAGGCEESPLCAGLETLRVAENGTAQCLTLAAWNQSCGEAVECVGLLRCSAEGRCECLGRLEEGLCLEAEDSCGDQNKILHRGLCLSPTERSCLSDVDCPEGSCGANLRCSSEEIVCRPDEVAVDRLCFPQVRLDEACRRNEQCVGASCIEGRCGCVADEVEVDGICAKNNGFCRQTNSVFWKGECLPRVTLGASCHTSSQCPRRSVCFNATCQCPSGTTHDGDGCREYTESPRLLEEGLLMGQKCLRTEDCVAPLACLQRMCQCPLGGVFDGLQCLPTPQSPIPLNPKPLDCPRGTTRVGERCSPLMPPGNECQASAQCLDGAICVGGVCRCEATIAFGGYCMLKGGAEGCQINQVASKDRCLESVVPNGHGCTEDLQCLGGSLCDATGICLCPGGEGAWMGYCLEGKSLEKRGNDRCKQGEGICFAPQVVGGACVVSAQCPQSTLCSRRHLCECELGDVFPDGSCPSRGTPCNAYQVHVDDVCWDTVVVGGRCEKKEQCITKDSTCSASSKRCECTEDTEFDGDQCVALAGVRCPPRSVIANGMCFGTVAPGQFCQFDAQCAPHLGVCRQYACQCPEGHLEVDGYCRRA